MKSFVEIQGGQIMKTTSFRGYFAKLGLGAGVAVALGGAPVVAHAEDNMPSSPASAIESGSAATSRAATSAGNTAGSAATSAGNAAEKAGSEASGAADKAGNAASGAADKASDEASSAANKASRAATGAADDTSITDAVKGKLSKAGSDASDIKVDTDKGVVTLSGTVHSQSTRDSAGKMAMKVKGVERVKNDIEVLPTK
jgi:osmotically-inducible protein OsmY